MSLEPKLSTLDMDVLEALHSDGGRRATAVAVSVNRLVVVVGGNESKEAAMAAVQDSDWQAEVLDLKRKGLQSAEIAEAVGKHPATVRKVIARAKEDGTLEGGGTPSSEGDRVLSSGEAAEAFGVCAHPECHLAAAAEIVSPLGTAKVCAEHAHELGENSMWPDWYRAALNPDVPPDDDPEFEDRDPLDIFREEAGEAVGPMPPPAEEDTEPAVKTRVAGTRQMALDFGPEADIPVGGTLVIRSDKLASGFFGLGDVIEGRFTARIVDVGGKERLQRASEEFRAQPQSHVALITDIDLGA